MVSSACCYMFPATNCFAKVIVVQRQLPQQCTPFLSERTSVAMDVIPSLSLVCPLRTDEANKALNVKGSEWECCVAASCPLHSTRVLSTKVVCTGTAMAPRRWKDLLSSVGPGATLSPFRKRQLFQDRLLSKQHLSFSSYHISPPLSCLYPSSLALHSSTLLGGSLGLCGGILLT